jgi:hypothetical protein
VDSTKVIGDPLAQALEKYALRSSMEEMWRLGVGKAIILKD